MPNTTVFVVSHGWHTGFVVPAKAMQRKIHGLNTRFQRASYIEFGWGDEQFYQASEITTGLTLRAILWPTESVIHAVGVPDNVAGFYQANQLETLCLKGEDFQALIEFIVNSFYRNKSGQVIPLQAGLYGDSQFYMGAGQYYLTNTCNSWTAKGLASAGFNISPVFKQTAGSIMNYLKSVHQTSDVGSQADKLMRCSQ